MYGIPTLYWALCLLLGIQCGKNVASSDLELTNIEGRQTGNKYSDNELIPMVHVAKEKRMLQECITRLAGVGWISRGTHS